MSGSRTNTSNRPKKREKIDKSTTTAAATRSNNASLADDHEQRPPAKKTRVAQRSPPTARIKSGQITPGRKRQSSHAVNDNRQNPSTATKTPTQQQRRTRRKVIVSPVASSNISTKRESTIVAEPVLSSSSSSSRVPGANVTNGKFRRVTEQFDVDECRSALLVSSSPSTNQHRVTNIQKEKNHHDSGMMGKGGRKVVVKPQKAEGLHQQQQQQQQQVVATAAASERKHQGIKSSSSRALVVPGSKPRNIPNAVASGSAITTITTNTGPKDTKVEKSSVMTIRKPTTNSSSQYHSPDVTKSNYKHNQHQLLDNDEGSTCSRVGGGIRNGIVCLIWIIWYLIVVSVLGTLGTHMMMRNRYGSKWMFQVPKYQEGPMQTIQQLWTHSETIESMKNKIQKLEIDWVNEELTYLSDLHYAEETITLLKQRIQSLQNEINEQQNKHSKIVLSLERSLEQLKNNLANQESIYGRKLEEADDTILSWKHRLLKEGNEHKTQIALLRNDLHQQQEEHTETLTLVQTLLRKLEVVQEELQERKITYENELDFANKSLEELKQQIAKKEEVWESNAIIDLKDQLHYEKQHKIEALEVIETLREKLNRQEDIHTKSLEEIQILQGQVQSEKRLTNEKSNQLQLVTRNIADLKSELSIKEQIVTDATSSMQKFEQSLKEMQQLHRRQKLSSVLKKNEIARLTKELYRQQEIAIETVNFVTTMAIQEQQDAAADVVNFVTRTVASQHAHELERQQEIAIETINFVATTALHEQQQEEIIPDDTVAITQKILKTTKSNQCLPQDEQAENKELGDTIPILH